MPAQSPQNPHLVGRSVAAQSCPDLVSDGPRWLRFLGVLATLLALALTSMPGPARADEDDDKDAPALGGPERFKQLKYRLIGPAAGGRVSRACGVPGDPLTYYAAVAAGGVWKSSDGGFTWKPIFDKQPISSIGSIAVAPSDPNVIYVGSGEANIRGNVAAGNGIYRSTDAGKNWSHVWKQEGQIGTMIVHPANPDIALAAVLGHAFGPNPERGVYRTADGGKTWERVLFVDDHSGASDVCFDPNNPRILFAGTWQTRRRPWELVSGGPGSGLHMSRNGGDTWIKLGPQASGSRLQAPDIAPDPKPEAQPPKPRAKPEPRSLKPEASSLEPGKGLPPGIWGKVCVAVASSDSRRVYALIEAEEGGLFRSDDGGDSWKRINASRYLRQRPWYFNTVHVDPKNPDVVWCPNVRLLKSIDGGKSFKQVKGPHHVDHHDIWFDPHNPKRMIDSNDGGVDITVNGGETWHTPMLPVAQFYHISCDNRVPYYVSGNMQDLGTASGPSNSLSSDDILLGDWHTVGGGETGFSMHDPSDPNIVYSGEYGGYLSRYDHRTRQARNVSIYPFNPSGHGAGDLRYRFQWTAPVLISRHDPKTVYHGANVLFRTTDGGQSWTPVSPDLTRDDKNKQKWSGGPITGDNTTAEFYCTIFALAESPRQKGVLWAGSDDGLIHVTQDGGKNWNNVTPSSPLPASGTGRRGVGGEGWPEWGTVSCIEASPHDAGTAYVVVDAHRLDNMKPYLYKTSDFGKTWKSLSNSLPQDVYLHAVREDPKKKGLLYLGTERGVAFSPDDGDTWEQLKLNLPTVAVHDLVVKDNDLVVGTNGRSIWILDDLTPVREWSAAGSSPPWGRGEGEGVHLFPVQPSVRWRYHPSVHSTADKRTAFKNPPKGAVIHYHLKAEPKQPIAMEILDADGKLVMKLTSKPQKPPASGTQRREVEKQIAEREPEEEEIPDDDPDTPWQKYKKPALTTKPGVNRVVWDLRYEGARKIRGAKVEGSPEIGPLANPGTYTIKLTVGGQTQTGTLVVKPDPRTKVSPAELGDELGDGLAEQLKLSLSIRDDLTKLTGAVERIRSVKKQLQSRQFVAQELVRASANGNGQANSLTGVIGELVEKLDALEAKFHNPRAEVAYDILAQKGGAKLYSQLAALLGFVQEGDGAPTQGAKEVYAENAKRLQELLSELKALEESIGKFNQQAKDSGVPAVALPGK